MALTRAEGGERGIRGMSGPLAATPDDRGVATMIRGGGGEVPPNGQRSLRRAAESPRDVRQTVGFLNGRAI